MASIFTLEGPQVAPQVRLLGLSPTGKDALGVVLALVGGVALGAGALWFVRRQRRPSGGGVAGLFGASKKRRRKGKGRRRSRR